ncbi:hypothetical protein DL765_010358 [Monosporascus sp. GIB2]|nr:hypothetical protein DL765_010358 [Monosporascus sp. GIB2]
MGSSREKLPVTYDDLPEVVIPHSEAQAYVDEGRRVEPGESPPKFLATDPAQKEVAYPTSPEVAYPTSPEVAWGHDFTAAGAEGDHISPTTVEQSLGSDGQRKQTQGRICNCSTKTLWAMLVLVLITMGAAIGGGVGGSRAASRGANNQPLGADAPSRYA